MHGHVHPVETSTNESPCLPIPPPRKDLSEEDQAKWKSFVEEQHAAMSKKLAELFPEAIVQVGDEQQESEGDEGQGRAKARKGGDAQAVPTLAETGSLPGLEPSMEDKQKQAELDNEFKRGRAKVEASQSSFGAAATALASGEGNADADGKPGLADVDLNDAKKLLGNPEISKQAHAKLAEIMQASQAPVQEKEN